MKTLQDSLFKKLLIFVAVCNNLCIYQVNSLCNRNNKFLDLIFSSNFENIMVYHSSELLDNNTMHHSALHIDITLNELINDKHQVSKNFHNVKLKLTKQIMKNSTFNLLSDDDILEVIYHNPLNMIKKINDITKYLQDIQSNCTSVINKKFISNQSKHLWLKNNKSYDQAFKYKVMIKKTYDENPTTSNKQ